VNSAAPPRALWVVSDGAAGNENQALALANALGGPSRTLRVAPAAPWRWFAPRWVPHTTHALGLDLAPPWPELAIGCGRQGALALRTLARVSGGATRTVQILDPRINPAAFDLVIVPTHDRLRGANVIVTRGALHAIDADHLAQARRDWPQLGEHPAPRIAVLLGGPNAALKLDPNYWRGLATGLGHWITHDGGSLRPTRRTGRGASCASARSG
jgi:mitochondrial fission protein ELM1